MYYLKSGQLAAFLIPAALLRLCDFAAEDKRLPIFAFSTALQLDTIWAGHLMDLKPLRRVQESGMRDGGLPINMEGSMQKSLTMALAAAGLLAASQVSFANALAPSSGTNLAAQESSQIVPARMGGGGGGGFGHGGGGMGHAGGVQSFGMGHGSVGHGPMMGHGPMIGRGPMIGHGRVTGHGRSFARHFRHGHFREGPFFGFGLDYGYPDGDGGGSCYLNCRSEGHGPRYCQAYALEYCY